MGCLTQCQNATKPYQKRKWQKVASVLRKGPKCVILELSLQIWTKKTHFELFLNTAATFFHFLFRYGLVAIWHRVRHPTTHTFEAIWKKYFFDFYLINRRGKIIVAPPRINFYTTNQVFLESVDQNEYKNSIYIEIWDNFCFMSHPNVLQSVQRRQF